MSASRRSPWLAGLLSAAAPGLGQLYNGERAKGWSMLCITAGLFVTGAVSHSGMTLFLLGPVYLFVLIPAVVDAYHTALGRATGFSCDAPWYVITMLLTVVPLALPLLWQNQRFSWGSKIGWTVAVVLMTVACIALLRIVGPALEQLLPLLQSSL